MVFLMPPRELPGYQPSPQLNRTYSGPAVPTAYDVNWQIYTNLTPDQIAWFQAQPEWANFVAWVALNPAQATGQPWAPSPTEISTILQTAGRTVSTAPSSMVIKLNG